MMHHQSAPVGWAGWQFDTSRNGTNFRLWGPEAGELVVCIHGISSYSWVFDNIAEVLSVKGFRVLTYDLVGRGHSEPAERPASGYGAEGYLAQLRDLMSELGLADKPAHLLGYSMGGAVATLVALDRAPHLTLSLVLLCPVGLMNTGAMALLRNACCCGIWPLMRCIFGTSFMQERSWRRVFAHHGTECEESMLELQRLQRTNNPNAFDAFVRSVQQFPLVGLEAEVSKLASRDLKVLLLWGDADVVVPFEPNQSRWAEALRAGACTESIEVFKDSGHAFLHENEEETLLKILGFLHPA